MKSKYYTVTTIMAILALPLVVLFILLLRIFLKNEKKRMMRYNRETLEAMR